MKYLVYFFVILGLSISARAADYQICTMKNERVYLCNSRDQMRLFLQAMATKDNDTQQQLMVSGDCGSTFAKNIKEIREYDVVKTPIATDGGMIYIEIAWVKIQPQTSNDFHDYFIDTSFLVCK
jgi:hypothetical protein